MPIGWSQLKVYFCFVCKYILEYEAVGFEESLIDVWFLFVVVEVVKVLRAKKYAKTKKQQLETLEKLQAGQEKQSSGCDEAEEGKSEKENINHVCRFISSSNCHLSLFFVLSFWSSSSVMRN